MRFRLSVHQTTLTCATALWLVSLAPAPAAEAGTVVDQSRFQALHWRGIGPYRGGRVLAVTGVTGEPNVYYFGAVAGGVWKTTDGGVSWIPLTDQTTITSIGAIAVAPSNRDIVYVGAGEASPRGDITNGNGVFKSLDGGKTWQSLGLSDTRQIGALIVDPKNPNIVLVAALGHAFGPNAERGVYRTADGGKTLGESSFKERYAPARSMSRLTRTIRRSCTHLCGRPCASRGPSRAAAKAAGSTIPPTAGLPGRACPVTDFLLAFSDESTFRCPAPIQNASMR